jgi:hypothetical protein
MPAPKRQSLDGLRKSILLTGPLLPVVTFQGVTIDGRRRAEICDSAGIEYTTRHYLTPEDAAPVLWALHPERCAELFPAPSISAAAELYAATLSEVAHLYQRPAQVRGPRAPGYWRRTAEARPARHYSLMVEPTLWDQVGRLATRHGLSRSVLIRCALAYATTNPDEILELHRLEGHRLSYKRGRRHKSAG